VTRIRWAYVLLVTVAALGLQRPSVACAAGARFYAQTGFAVDDPQFLDYFDKRGGVRTFGYPVSREFTFLGFPAQIFQRAIMQKRPDSRLFVRVGAGRLAG
jgi:hypothetical protein